MKSLYTTVFLLSIVFLTNCTQEQTPILPPPNIILLMSEDNSPFLGCYGDTSASTPHLDAFAKEGVKFNNAFTNAPVCAPSRSTLISGMYATSMGTQHMRSENNAPTFMHFFPYYLKKAGYYTSNRVKKDYNTTDQKEVWDITDWWGWEDALKNKKKEQPFFLMYNTWMSHESKIHDDDDKNFDYFNGTMKEHGIDSLQIKTWWNSAKSKSPNITLPDYHPDVPAIQKDWNRYYECVELMDREMGVVLQKIKADGLWENSIIFYCSDHGGVLPRSKRFVYESGLKIPFIMHVPEKYKNLVQQKMGTTSDQVISLIDLAPTILSLAGIDIPTELEGKSFLNHSNNNQYAFGFRGRMDERYDLVRTVRDQKFRYIRNYMPHRISGGKVKYLWKAASIRAWEKYYQNGNCDEQQAAFWQNKAVEELYKIDNDSDNNINLSSDPQYAAELNRLRTALQNHLLKTKDLGFIPEAEMIRRSADSSPYDFIRTKDFPFEKILATANLATAGNIENLDLFIKRLSDSEPTVRYWAAVAFTILKTKGLKAKTKLFELLNDKSPSVRIATAEALYHLGEKEKAISTLVEILELPKMGKNNLPSNKELYANHFAITHAINVIDALNIDNKKIGKLLLKIANSERVNKRDYDKLAAQDLIDSTQPL